MGDAREVREVAMRQLQGVISTQGKLQVSLVLLPAALGHNLKKGDARKNFGDLLAIWIRGEQALLRFQVMVPIDKVLGRSNKQHCGTEDAGENPCRTNEE